MGRRKRDAQSGFSLIELLVVVCIGLIVSAVAVDGINSTIKDGHVNSAYTTTLATLRRAREAAITQRQTYKVTFTAPGTITVAPTTALTGSLNITATLPSDVAFDVEPGVPNSVSTVPDGLGLGASTGAIDFDATQGAGGLTVVYFWPDGSARDGAGNLNDGIVYIARPGQLSTSRAITVRGLTGRLRGWRLEPGVATPWIRI
jgi:prepilin-type N-terminal cleavage/methylation domain-containing protein